MMQNRNRHVVERRCRYVHVCYVVICESRVMHRLVTKNILWWYIGFEVNSGVNAWKQKGK